MRDYDSEIELAEEELLNVEGTPCEVYTRICGYFRPTKNWNAGKQAELADRKNFVPNTGDHKRQSNESMEEPPEFDGGAKGPIESEISVPAGY